jgi:hypothetical protein
MAMVNIDKTVDMTSPAVGIGVEMTPISRDNSCSESIAARVQENSSCVNPKVDARRSLIWPWRQSPSARRQRQGGLERTHRHQICELNMDH